MKSVKWIVQRGLPIFLTAMLLSACGGTYTLYSNKFTRAPMSLPELRVMYLDNELKQQGSLYVGSLPAVGYLDLPELLRERVPLVFSLNGISAAYATIKPTAVGAKSTPANLWPSDEKTKAPILVVQFVGGSTLSNRAATEFHLNMHVNLYDGQSGLRIWTGQFRVLVVKRMIGEVYFDNAFADDMLKTILERMAGDGVLSLPGGSAKVPDKPRG